MLRAGNFYKSHLSLFLADINRHVDIPDYKLRQLPSMLIRNKGKWKNNLPAITRLFLRFDEIRACPEIRQVLKSYLKRCNISTATEVYRSVSADSELSDIIANRLIELKNKQAIAESFAWSPNEKLVNFLLNRFGHFSELTPGLLARLYHQTAHSNKVLHEMLEKELLRSERIIHMTPSQLSLVFSVCKNSELNYILVNAILKCGSAKVVLTAADDEYAWTWSTLYRVIKTTRNDQLIRMHADLLLTCNIEVLLAAQPKDLLEVIEIHSTSESYCDLILKLSKVLEGMTHLLPPSETLNTILSRLNSQTYMKRPNQS